MRTCYDDNAPHDEHAGHGDDQPPEFFDRTEPYARIQTELEIQQDETGRDRQQVGRDVDAVLQIEFDEQKPDDHDGGRYALAHRPAAAAGC